MPKYRQVIDSITSAVATGRLKVGDKLPSINQLCLDSPVKRDTVLLALNELRARGLVEGHHGKGFYVVSSDATLTQRVFMLFSEMSPYAVNIYNGLVRLLPSQTIVDVGFHHDDPARIAEFLKEKNGKYTSYILDVRGLDAYGPLVRRLNGSRTCLIGSPSEGLKEMHGIYHDAGRDMQDTLKSLRKQLKKYCRLVYLCKFPAENQVNIDVLKRFCSEESMDYLICHNPEELRPALYEAYFIPDDQVLASFIARVRKSGFILGENVGCIAYGESLLKEILEGGLTTVSYDFHDLCSRLAEFSLGQRRGSVRIKSRVIQRNSL